MLAFKKTCLLRIVLTLQIPDKNCVGRFFKQLSTKVTLIMVAILLNPIGLALCLEIPIFKVIYFTINFLFSSKNQKINCLTLVQKHINF